MVIRTRNDLLYWLTNNAPSRAIKRTVIEMGVENLGGFERIPPFGFQGWIVKVISKFKSTWHVAVVVTKHSHVYAAYLIPECPWKFWVGDTSNNPLYRGDHPEYYKLLRDKEL